MTNITIATHNGNFHADDVFSIAALMNIFPSFNLIRTRKLELIAKADIVIDVGGEYDADNGRFDHHQRNGAGQRENGIPYSSFGLVWQKYGVEICQGNHEVANSVDAGLVSTIDAIDLVTSKEFMKALVLAKQFLCLIQLGKKTVILMSVLMKL